MRRGVANAERISPVLLSSVYTWSCSFQTSNLSPPENLTLLPLSNNVRIGKSLHTRAPLSFFRKSCSSFFALFFILFASQTRSLIERAGPRVGFKKLSIPPGGGRRTEDADASMAQIR